jgi:hypothetical protein
VIDAQYGKKKAKPSEAQNASDDHDQTPLEPQRKQVGSLHLPPLAGPAHRGLL